MWIEGVLPCFWSNHGVGTVQIKNYMYLMSVIKTYYMRIIKLLYLRSIAVWSWICHTQDTRTIVLQSQTFLVPFIIKLGPIDASSSYIIYIFVFEYIFARESESVYVKSSYIVLFFLPVPLWLVKSPPFYKRQSEGLSRLLLTSGGSTFRQTWSMKLGIILWKPDPL